MLTRCSLFGVIAWMVMCHLDASNLHPRLPVPAPTSYAPLPEAVTSFGAAVLDGSLYVFGGHRGERHEYSAEAVSGACHRLNLDEGIAWERLPDAVAAQSPGMAAAGKHLYRVGGMAARNAKGEEHDLFSHAMAERLLPGSTHWETLPALSAPRSSHDAAAVGDRLYVVGGWQLNGRDTKPTWHDTAMVLDLEAPDTGWQIIPQPFQRRGLAAAALNQRLYCIGGMTDADSTSAEVDILDTSTGVWSKGPPLPQGRMRGFGAAACVANGRLYVNGFSGTVWRLNEDGDAWEEFAQLRKPRFFHRLLAGNHGQLLAIGGESENGKLSEIEIIPLTPAAPDAAGWPGYRGPHRDGTTTEPVDTKHWSVAGPAVLWRAALGKGLSSLAVSGNNVITVGNTNDTDTVWCLSPDDGSVRWRFDYPCASTNHPMPIVPYGPAATPTLHDGKVYTLSREGHFFCLEASTGRLLWRVHLLEDLGGKRPVYGYATSPLVTGGLVFLDVGGLAGSTLALDATTGAVRWRSGSGEAGYSSPRLANVQGQGVLALFKGEAFTWMDPATGTVMGAHATTVRDFCNTMLPAVAGAVAFVSNTGKDGTARVDLRGTEPTVVWRRSDLGLLFSSPVLWQGRLYAFNDAKRNENELICLDAASGETRWTFGEVEKGAFILADGQLIVLTRQGELAVLSLGSSGPRVEARAQVLGGKSYIEPVLAGGRLYCRNNEGQLVCLDLRRPAAGH